MTGLKRGMGPALFVLALAVGARVQAQENFDAGKTGAQLYASDCAICHKSPQGLNKSGGLLGLSSFLREHYTASKESAAAIAAYLDTVGSPPASAKRAGAAKRTAKGDDKAKADDKAKGDEKAKADEKKNGKPKADEAKAKDSDKAKTSEQAKTDSKPEPKTERKTSDLKSGEAKESKAKDAKAKDAKTSPPKEAKDKDKAKAASTAKPDKKEKSN